MARGLASKQTLKEWLEQYLPIQAYYLIVAVAIILIFMSLGGMFYSPTRDECVSSLLSDYPMMNGANITCNSQMKFVADLMHLGNQCVCDVVVCKNQTCMPLEVSGYYDLKFNLRRDFS